MFYSLETYQFNVFTNLNNFSLILFAKMMNHLVILPVNLKQIFSTKKIFEYLLGMIVVKQDICENKLSAKIIFFSF